LGPSDHLVLLRWLSPSFPTGSFAWSHGLERAAGTRVRDAETLRDWLADALRHGAGRTDAILIGAAWRAGDLAEVAEVALALSPSRERRAEAMGQGAAFAAAVRAADGLDLPDLPLPVAVGRAARLRGLPLRATGEAALLAWVTGLVQAAQRLLPLGQSAGARIVADLAPVCAEVAAACDLPVEEAGSCAFALDIAALRHETMEPRIFRS
jgi:urease accessory protein